MTTTNPTTTAAASQPSAPTAPHRPPSHITGDPVGLRIDVLIVDDTRPARQVLASLLREVTSGIKMEQAGDGKEALAAWRKFQPRITFLDIDMPLQNGLEVLKAIRATSPSAFVVMVSANSSSHNVEAALDAGANGFVVKPFKPQRFIDVLEHYAKVTGHDLMRR